MMLATVVGARPVAADVAPGDRLEALNALFLATDLPQRVTSDHAALIKHRTELLDLGDFEYQV